MVRAIAAMHRFESQSAFHLVRRHEHCGAVRHGRSVPRALHCRKEPTMISSAQIVASSTHVESKEPGHIAIWRSGIIGVIAFLTLVDLFATQAILPSLAKVYGVSPSAIGFAVNASTMGMAVSCLGVALVSRHLNRRLGIWLSLALLAVPTSLLAIAPDLTSFAALRVLQG